MRMKKHERIDATKNVRIHPACLQQIKQHAA